MEFSFGLIGDGECMWYVVSPFSLQPHTICGGGVGLVVRTARRVGQNKSQSKYPKLKFRPLSARVCCAFLFCCCFSVLFFFFFFFLHCNTSTINNQVIFFTSTAVAVSVVESLPGF